MSGDINEWIPQLSDEHLAYFHDMLITNLAKVEAERERRKQHDTAGR